MVDTVSEAIAGYIIQRVIFVDGPWVWYEGLKKNVRCCIKVYRGNQNCQAFALLNHEKYLLSLLSDGRIPRAIELSDKKLFPFLVSEELLGVSLEQFTSGRLFPIETVLGMAASLCSIVALLHSTKIQHGRLSPRLFFINPDTEKIQLISLADAAHIKQRSVKIVARNISVESASYLAPEQTGYTLYDFIDFRADIFACGVIIYEMLLGRKPWNAKTSFNVIEQLLNETPLAPKEIDPSIPQAISDIVMRCLHKEPTSRYVSAAQLSKDLQDCQEQLKSHSVIFDTSFFEKIPTDELSKPSQLIGRKSEEQQIYATYTFACQSRCRWLLLIGEAGLGKTALARILLRSTAQKGGYYIAGNFGEQKLQIPYTALQQAMNDLIEQILEEEKSSLEAIKIKILDALEGHGAVLIEIFPALEKLIGRQPPMSFLKSQESQTRQVILFKRLICAIASEQTPLVLFLDDLQWADVASLRLIKALIVDPLINNVLVLSGCRPEAIEAAHFVGAIIQEVEQESGIIVSCQLKNLTEENTAELMKATIPSPLLPKEYPAIAAILYEKCGGNPFFLLMLLERFFEEKQLHTNLNAEEAAIASIGWTWHNLLARKLGLLPTSTQALLALGAQIDSILDLNVLSLAANLSEAALLRTLWPAVNAAIITPSNENYYQLEGQNEKVNATFYDASLPITFHFLQNVFYDLASSILSEEERLALHYNIGKQQLKKSRDDLTDSKLFEIVFHLNSGRSLIASDQERLQLAELNLEACRKAQAAVAHKTAFECIEIARSLLPKDSWEKNYDLSYAVYLESTTCAYLMKQFEQIEELSEVILSHAQTILDKGRLYVLKINFYTNISQNQMAIQEGITCLKLFGIFLKRHPSKATLLLAIVKVRWLMRGKKIAELAALAPMEQPEDIFVMQTLVALLPAAFILDKELVSRIVLLMVEFTLRFGSCEYSFYGFSTYAGVIEIIFHDYPKAFEFGLLALRMAEQTRDSLALARANYTMAVIINHWTHPLPSSRIYMDRCYNYGVTSGELVLLSFICMFYGFLDGEFFYNLDKAYHSVLAQKGLLLACKNKLALESFFVREAIINALTTPEFDGKDLNIVGFDEEDFLQRHSSDPELFSAIQAYVAYKMIVLCLFGNYKEALELFDRTQNSRRAAVTLITEKILNFYHSLSLLATYDQVGPIKKLTYSLQIIKNQKRLKWWSRCSAANNLHRYLLIKAEWARIKRKKQHALKLYDLAAQQARQNNHLMEEALIKERAAKYHLTLGWHVTANGYLTNSYQLYASWGSNAKLNWFSKKYPNLSFKDNQHYSNLPLENLHGKDYSRVSLVDITTVSQSLQSCYEHKNNELLPSQLIELLAANAGADHTAFLRKNHGIWEECLSFEKGLIQERQQLKDNSSLVLPAIYFAIRTRKNLLIENVKEHPTTRSKTYAAKSILIIPLSKNQKNCVALLYLENRSLTHAFSEKIVKLLTLLASQLYSAITNSCLTKEMQQVSQNLEIINTRLKNYSEELEKKIAKRTGELEDKNRELQKSMSQLETMQKKVLQREKLAGMGSLAQGFAHEIKNPLNFINNFASLSKEMLVDLEEENKGNTKAAPNLEQLKQIMIEVLEEGQRADNIIVNMLHFSAPGDQQVAIDVNEFLSNLVSIVKNKIARKYPLLPLEVFESYAANLPLLHGWVRRLGQAIGNLLEYISQELMAKWERANKNKEHFTPTVYVETILKIDQIDLSIKANIAEKNELHSENLLPPGIGLSMAYDIIVNEHGGAVAFCNEDGFKEFKITLSLITDREKTKIQI